MSKITIQTNKNQSENQSDMINIIEQIRLMNSFTIKLKPTVIPRLRRMPRGNNCLTDVWHPMVTYIIDPKRSTQEFILFNAIQDHSLCVIYQEPMKVNWWINTKTNEVGYDASSWMTNYVVKDPISDFIFTFTDSTNSKSSSKL